MKNSLVKIASLVLVFTALPLSTATAGKLSGVINGKSYHVDSSYDWNENNYGLGIEYEFDSDSRWVKTAMASGFRDSNDMMSYMAGGGLHRRLMQTDILSGLHIDAGINAFVMTRKDVSDGKPFPGVLPSVSIGNDVMGFNFTYLPKKAVESFMNATVNDPTIDGIFFVQFKINVEQLLPR